jgi:hypothetical protein
VHRSALKVVAGGAPAAGALLVGAVPVAALGFDDGGYGPRPVALWAIVCWWALLTGRAAGLLPAPAPRRAGALVIAALLVLVAWGGAGLPGSASPERGLTELVRLVAALGTVLLGLSVVAAGRARPLLAGVLAGLVALVGAAVLARLQPDLLPAAWGAPLNPNRLSWPLNYWNGLGAAAAMALALAVGLRARAGGPWTAALATAPVPVLVVAISLTLSRGAIVAAAAGVVVGVLVVRPRLVLLRSVAVLAAGSAAAVALVWSRSAIPDATGGAVGQAAGSAVLPLLVLLCAAVGAVEAAGVLADRSGRLPALPRPSRRARRAGVGVVGALVALTAGVLLATGAADRAWDGFRETPDAVVGREPSRLAEISGNERYEIWSGAVDAWRSAPVRGIGLGSWESWWNPRRGPSSAVRNAHSEPFELLAETGLVGGLAVLALLLAPMAAAWRRRGRGADALAALPVAVAFAVASAIDWSWQLACLPTAGLLAIAPLLGGVRGRAEPAVRPALRRLSDAGIAALAVVAVALGAVALIAPTAVERSRAAARAGDLPRAVREARSGARGAPFALSPVLQLVTVLERDGRLADAAAAAREATRREPENWRPWLVLARVEASRGRARAAVAAFGRARARNPSSPLLRDGAAP